MTKPKKIICILLALFFSISVSVLAAVSILKVLYPREYAEIVETTADEYGISPAFVYAVIECESGFDKNAVSSVGARGLMQIMPETFFWLQSKTKQELSEDSLFEPETNIKYGCYLYSILFKEFGNEQVVVAAYHAGFGNVRKWLKDERYSSDGKTLKDIPFPSTGQYVNKVIKTRNIYEKLYYGKDA